MPTRRRASSRPLRSRGATPSRDRPRAPAPRAAAGGGAARLLRDASAALHELVVQRRSESEILERSAALLADALGARYAAVALHDEEGRLSSFHSTGLTIEGVRRIGAPPSGRGLLGHVLRAAAPIRLADLTRHPAFTGFPPGHPPMRTLLRVPLVHRGRPFGHVYACEKRAGAAFGPEDEHVAACFAEMLALALGTARAWANTRRSNARYRSIVESVSDVISIVHPDGAIEYESPAIEPLTGWRPTELEGRSILDWIHPEDRDLVARSLGAIARRGGSIRGGYRFRWKDGGYRAVESVAARIEGDGGPTRILVTSRDMTDRERLEAELVQAREAAERASAAKSELLANVSHELRTPLNAVIGMADLLEETPLDAEQRELLGTIRSSGDMLLGLVSDLLDLARIERGEIALEPRPFSPRLCVEEALDLLAPAAAAKGLELVCDVAPEVPEAAVADASRLRQVLVNLVGNAVKFTDEGEVVVQVHLHSSPGAALELAFSVRDTGIGIAAADRERIFEPFRQGDGSATRRHGGAGLGLAVCRRFVHALGGEISVRSTPGQGSTFRFSIRARAAPDASSPRGPLAERPTSVLLAARSEPLAAALDRLLASWGLRVERAAPDPATLVERAAATPFAAAILDPDPGDDGAASIEELGRRSVPTLLLRPLGRGRETTIRSGGGLEGGPPTLAKPVRASALREALAALLARSGAAAGGGPTARPHSRGGQAKRPLRVLVAEDNRVNQRVTTRMLGRLGHKVDLAADGREAVEAAERSRYDVVLMDIQMPRMSGLEATRAIRERLAPDLQPAIIALTANATLEERERCRAAGMDGFLAKPVELAVLEEALRDVLDAPSRAAATPAAEPLPT